MKTFSSKLLVIFGLSAALLMTGCATQSDVARVQGEIDALTPKVTSLESDAKAAKAAATDASVYAASAERAAMTAETQAKGAATKVQEAMDAQHCNHMKNCEHKCPEGHNKKHCKAKKAKK